MKHSTPEFGNPSVKIQTVTASYSGEMFEAPVFDTPITPKENFKLAAKRSSPLWVPNALTDIQGLLTQSVAGHNVRGMQIHNDMLRRATEDYLFYDWFGASWTWVCSAGGAMLTPGTIVLEDITNWEKELKWPDLSEWGFEEKAAQYMRETYDPNKVMQYDLGRGCTERLVSIMGGYTEAMLALAVEPEAVSGFFDRYIDFMISVFDKMNSLYPLDMVTLHDDWGTERDTFFSEKMMEDLVFAPTKRFVDHVKSKGVIFELHSCGNITRFVPYMIQLGADFLQIQRRAVDIPMLKKQYGDKIGFNGTIEGIAPGESCTESEITAAVRRTVDTYAAGGGFYTGIPFREPRDIWTAVSELYAYSREYYDAERAFEK